MKRKTVTTDAPEIPADDALFEELEKKKKKKRRKILITVGSIVLAAAIAATAGVLVLRRRVREQFAGTRGEVLSYTAAIGTIRSTVSGSGRLTDVDLEAVTVPDGVEITEVKVKANQAIAEGDVLATVDMASVISTMSDLQEEIDAVDAQLRSASGESASTSVSAGVAGRVKAVYGAAGDEVADVMYEYGALALLSLDGYMSVRIETDALAAGESVTVEFSGGEEISGAVESAVGGEAVILVTDDGTALGETVTVKNGDGGTLGTGELSVHSAMRVTGYAGTIANVLASENTKVYASSVLFTLKNTEYSASYNALLRERQMQEDTLLELLTIQHDGAVLAKQSGSVYSVDYTDGETAVATLSADKKMSVTISVSESDILSLKLGQTVSVSVSSVSEDAFEGTITEIDRSGGSSSGSYSAVIEIEKTEGMLSGMTASVSVQISGVDNAVLVPVAAVHKTSDGAYVYTEYDEETQQYGGRVDVVTGLENSTYIEIKSGLAEGDIVYYTEQETGFGGFTVMPGGFGDGSSGSGAPGFSGGGGFGGGGGGSAPDFGGGGMPSFGG